MNASKTYLIVNAVPNTDDRASLQSYVSQIVEIFKLHGAVNFQRFKTVEQIMGKGNITATAIVEFPNSDAIHKMYTSTEFNSLNDLRKKAYQQEVDLMICEAL